MDREQFSALLRDALANIYDYAVLEKHPLNDALPRPNPSVRKAENLRAFIGEGIKAMMPSPASTRDDSLEWRYYRILLGRYIEGLTVAALQKNLGLGERQERRMHHRALSALEEILWDRLNEGRQAPPPEAAPANGENAENAFSFPVTLEPLHLGKVVEETAALFLPKLQAHGGEFSIHLPDTLPFVHADRVILRQILLHLFSRALQGRQVDEIAIRAFASRAEAGAAPSICLEIAFLAVGGRPPTREDLLTDTLFAYWLERLKAELFLMREDAPETEESEEMESAYVLSLPMPNQLKILVVDDHEPAVRIVQRYLSQTNIQVTGTGNPSEVLPLARSLRPDLVLMDVMMPGTDGWEILQKLKSDPETRHVPVIICSVWDQPDLAYSLGADAFLKKPIIQSELLGELARLSLMDTSGEFPPADL